MDIAKELLNVVDRSIQVFFCMAMIVKPQSLQKSQGNNTSSSVKREGKYKTTLCFSIALAWCIMNSCHNKAYYGDHIDARAWCPFHSVDRTYIEIFLFLQLKSSIKTVCLATIEEIKKLIHIYALSSHCCLVGSELSYNGSIY